MNKLKVMTIFGTRPEAIKMSPLIKELEKNEQIDSIVTVTAQHREMLDQVLNLFNIKPDYDLNIMKKAQSLTDITTNVLIGLKNIIANENPDIVLVHGDTTTTFVGSLSSFYQKVKIGHIEAGLRTNNKYSPYPEEMNRKITGVLADLHFAPTNIAKSNLLNENILEKDIFITGNTVIDALLSTVDKEFKFNISELNNIDFKNKKIILLTAHRRENLGKSMKNIFRAIKVIVENNNVEVIFPVHLNPKIRVLANEILGDIESIHLIEPLEYESFANLIAKSYLIITDSGGIQEEAPGLGKPVLVLRNTTERPEALEAGTVKLVGTNMEKIISSANKLIRYDEEYQKMANAVNPYGDGNASKKIVDVLINKFNSRNI